MVRELFPTDRGSAELGDLSGVFLLTSQQFSQVLTKGWR